MPFAIIARDAPGKAELRAKLRQVHVDYLTARKGVLLAAGAMLDDAGAPIGGLLIVDTEDRAVAEEFSAGDPFTTGGVFGDVQIVPWRKSFFAFESLR
ncbi:MAG: YciI family protein [Pseudomonadota bacterium]